VTAITIPPHEASVATIVMPVYGAQSELERALRHLIDNTDVPYDVVIVDTPKGDGT